MFMVTLTPNYPFYHLFPHLAGIEPTMSGPTFSQSAEVTLTEIRHFRSSGTEADITKSSQIEFHRGVRGGIFRL